MKKLIVLSIFLTNYQVTAKAYEAPQLNSNQDLAQLIKQLYSTLTHDPIEAIETEIAKRKTERPRDLERIRELKLEKQVSRIKQDLHKLDLLRAIRHTMRTSSDKQIITAIQALSSKLNAFPRATLFAYIAAFAKPEEQRRLSDIYTRMYIDPRTTDNNYAQFAGELYKQGANVFKRSAHDYGLSLDDMQEIFGGNNDKLNDLKAFGSANPKSVAQSIERIKPYKHTELFGFYEYTRHEALGANKTLDSAIKNTGRKLRRLEAKKTAL